MFLYMEEKYSLITLRNQYRNLLDLLFAVGCSPSSQKVFHPLFPKLSEFLFVRKILDPKFLRHRRGESDI